MSDNHTENEHIGIPGYLGVFGILVVGTIVTYLVALQDLDGILFPGANTLLALAIAFTKMTFVILFFMHVRWQSKLIWLSAVAAFFWMAIMFAYTMQDYLTRSTGIFTQ
ncbi:MAG: cytochrome C oxidase subunit IV family protein [Acidobacteria bacterium]|nr:cytochrome C oxidase subunit IV family protein [Acidobacteriota bacterium]